jgi:hypothetical protein
MGAWGGIIVIYYLIRYPAFKSDFETYAIILTMYGLNSSIMSNSLALGRVSGFLSNSFAIISFMKGETVEGRDAGSLLVIEVMVKY